jgi:hypothetical protein
VAQPIGAETRPTTVICCLPDGQCTELDEAGCDAWQVADEEERSRPSRALVFDVFADPDPEGLGEQVLLNRPDMVEAVVERCEPPTLRPELSKSLYLSCSVRLGMDGRGEQLALTWPLYSKRWEKGHPNFQDPVVGDGFWLTLDDRFKENVVFFSRHMQRASLAEVTQ